MLRRNESEQLHKALVAELAYSIVPTSIMGATLLGVGSYAYGVTGDPWIMAATFVGAIASAAKIALILRHRHARAYADPALPVVRRIERLHATLTCGMAGSVGALATLMFAAPDIRVHLVATALLFGYCAGVITRVSVRPTIAIAAVVLAATPTLASASLFGGCAHLIVAAIFLVFLVGGMETIAYVYRRARGEIELRLEMAFLARRDPLTQLLNRLGLQEAFGRLSREAGALIALHAFDLDGFKLVNDTLGHAAGDRLLNELADRLRSIAGERVAVARIGGDEFVILQSGIAGELGAATLAHQAHALLTKPCDLGAGENRNVGVSLGYCVAPVATAILDDLIRAADQAAYAAKREGGGVRGQPAPVPRSA